MTSAAERLLEEALSLDQDDRASLAGALVASLHDRDDSPVRGTRELDRVVGRRVEELRSGEVRAIPDAEARDRLFRGFD